MYSKNIGLCTQKSIVHAMDQKSSKNTWGEHNGELSFAIPARYCTQNNAGSLISQRFDGIKPGRLLCRIITKEDSCYSTYNEG